jgi:hypothetical protein
LAFGQVCLKKSLLYGATLTWVTFWKLFFCCVILSKSKMSEDKLSKYKSSTSKCRRH